MAISAVPQIKRWTVTDYQRLGELGFFGNQRVELLGGQIVEMSPKGPRHAALLELIRQAIAAVFPADRFYVRLEQPLTLGREDEPEPDLAVVAGQPRDYLAAHPTGALLVIEIADTTLAYDRGPKAERYAAAGITDYWIVSLPERNVEVCRQPLPNAASPVQYHYTARQRLTADDEIAPLAAPDRPIAIARLLP